MSEPIVTYTKAPAFLLNSVAPPVRSKLRIVAGSDAVTFHYPQPVPNLFVRLMTRLLLRMEWVEVHPLGDQ